MITCPFTAEVADLGGLGDGIVRHPDGPVVLVPRVVPGDLLRIDQLAKQRGVLRATAFAVIAPSPQRCEPACAVFDECGGCALQHWSLDRQLQWKRGQLARAVGLAGRGVAGRAPACVEHKLSPPRIAALLESRRLCAAAILLLSHSMPDGS